MNDKKTEFGEICEHCKVPRMFHVGYDHGKGRCLVDGSVVLLGKEGAELYKKWAQQSEKTEPQSDPFEALARGPQHEIAAIHEDGTVTKHPAKPLVLREKTEPQSASEPSQFWLPVEIAHENKSRWIQVETEGLLSLRAQLEALVGAVNRLHVVKTVTDGDGSWEAIRKHELNLLRAEAKQ